MQHIRCMTYAVIMASPRLAKKTPRSQVHLNKGRDRHPKPYKRLCGPQHPPFTFSALRETLAHLQKKAGNV